LSPCSRTTVSRVSEWLVLFIDVQRSEMNSPRMDRFMRLVLGRMFPGSFIIHSATFAITIVEKRDLDYFIPSCSSSILFASKMNVKRNPISIQRKARVPLEYSEITKLSFPVTE
jgi:hypothetical protein